MDVWTISDLHLGPGNGKGHFSSKWIDHQPKLRAAWDETVPEESIVLMPGDFSWNQHPSDLWYDYAWMNDRPGQQKIISPGNHDYGVWKTREDVHRFCEDFTTLEPLLGEALRIPNPLDPDAPGLVVGGTMGSMTPEDHYYDSKGGWSKMDAPSDEALLVRELGRLERAVGAALRLRQPGDTFVMMIHYPPFADQTKPNVYAEVMEAAGVDVCLYGHLHQRRQWPIVRQGVFGSIDYRFVGADFLQWKPIRLGTFDEHGFTIDRVRRHAVVYWKWLDYEKKWDGWIETHDPERVPAPEVIRGSRRAPEPPPNSVDWDPNSDHFGIGMNEFDPVGLFVGLPAKIRGYDGKCLDDEPIGPFPIRVRRRDRDEARRSRRPRVVTAEETTGGLLSTRFGGGRATLTDLLTTMAGGRRGLVETDVERVPEKPKRREIPTAADILARIASGEPAGEIDETMVETPPTDESGRDSDEDRFTGGSDTRPRVSASIGDDEAMTEEFEAVEPSTAR